MVARRVVPTAVAVAILVGSGVGVLAGKPPEVVGWSNGFPSGDHFNLNIHGKKADYACDPSPGGGSVFVPEYGASEIDLVQNKRSALATLVARDPCAGFDGDAALVQLPAGEYQVYARILAKPTKDAEERSVVFYPKLVEACNDSGTANFTDAVSCDESFLMGTGVVTTGGVFEVDSQSFTRNSGKSKAVDITGMFTWTGSVCDQAFDMDRDGDIDLDDLLALQAAGGDADLNDDGLVDAADLELYVAANCTALEDVWVFDIADLVVYGWDWVNHGSKLVQVRFYPLSTTTFG